MAVPTHNRQTNAGTSSPHLITEFTSTNPQSAGQIISVLCSNDDQCLLMYGCETWSLHLRQKHRLSENRMLLGIFVHEGEDTQHCIIRSFIICTVHKLVLGRSNTHHKMGRKCSTLVQETYIHLCWKSCWHKYTGRPAC